MCPTTSVAAGFTFGGAGVSLAAFAPGRRPQNRRRDAGATKSASEPLDLIPSHEEEVFV
jgi:hypothetical protein